jgi:cell division protease FtsH
MEDNKEKQKQGPPRINPPRPPRFNIYWVYGLILVVLLVVNFFPFSRSAKLISFEEFSQSMLQTQDVEKLVVVNKEYVEVYIKKDRLSDVKYKDVATTSFNTTNPGPHYRFKILSVDDFTKKLSDAETQIAQKDPNYQPVQVFLRIELIGLMH